ncbi:MAG: alpha/beta fold hydrolase [Acidimicrobiales bacterium]
MEALRITNGPTVLSALRTDAGQGMASAPPVLFLHGITSCSDTWIEAMERLEGRFECWALDFRGHGGSDRASGRYSLEHYAADAGAALERIGRPAVVVGHSLGGMTAAHLGHNANPLVSAVFLEDPPLYLSDPAVFANTVYPERFRRAREMVLQLAAAGASSEDYLALARDTPSAMGGVEGDHLTERQLISRARQLAQFDPSCLDFAIDGRVFAGLDATLPIACPAVLLAANPALGAAFLDDDHARFAAANPSARIIPFPEVGHPIHAAKVSATRFLDELDAFVSDHHG